MSHTRSLIVLAMLAVVAAIGSPGQVSPLVAGNLTQEDDKTFTSKTTGMKFVRIKAGTFTMGSPKDEKGRSEDETQHEVTLTKDFYLGMYTVTRGQFRKFVEDTGYQTEAEADGKGGTGLNVAKTGWNRNPKFSWRNSGFEQTDEHPVINVTWNDAVNFAEWLSRKDGQVYRLPTEAEWEYACRGGTTSRYYFGNDDEDLAKYANVADADFRKATGINWGIQASDGYAFTAPVGRFKPNAFGLYDMHGNVWQWCADRYGEYPTGRVTDPTGPAQGTFRMFRGGSWNRAAANCRSAERARIDPSLRDLAVGFRLVRVPSGQ
jgi:formylglycine-generating enzyme required for sulfatase activity